jgi:hypothetical protein
MNIKIRNFFNIPIVKALINAFIIVLIFLNVFFSYQDRSTQNYIEKKINSLSFLQNQNVTSNDQSDYFNSQLNREKVFKEEGYKVIDEEVIETNLVENTANFDETIFLPSQIQNNDSNLIKWWNCLITGSVNKKIIAKDVPVTCI